MSQMTLFPSGTGLASLRSGRKQERPKVHVHTQEPDTLVAEQRGTYTTRRQQARRSQRTDSSQFKGSSRYYRGRIVEMLRGLPVAASLNLDTLGPSLKPDFADADREWLNRLLQQLAKDGLIKIAGETADSARISLP